MGRLNRVTRSACTLAMMLAVVSIASTVAHSQPATPSSGIEAFFAALPGDWIGTVSQSTDGKFSDTKYFHVATKQLTPDIFETVFTYYRLDEKTGAPVLSGVSGMATKIDDSGLATNTLIGKGDIMVEPNSWKTETHEITELLRTAPAGGLEGTGSGKISVIGMPLNAGKNGKVKGYTSTWSVTDDVLSISQRFKVAFKVFLFSKSYTITADYTAKRGTDIVGLMKDAKAALPPP